MFLQLAVFDLDYTIWEPEMYQINGPPKLTEVESSTNSEKKIVTDQDGTPINMFDGASYAISMINKLRKTHNIKMAVASRTDEADWAYKCMDLMTLHPPHDETTLGDSCDFAQIEEGDKQKHFRQFHNQTMIPYENMAFFDNEWRNIQSVRKLGVKCFYTPDGMTREAWDDAMREFEIDLEDIDDSD